MASPVSSNPAAGESASAPTAWPLIVDGLSWMTLPTVVPNSRRAQIRAMPVASGSCHTTSPVLPSPIAIDGALALDGMRIAS